MPGIGPGSRGFATQGCHRTNFSSRQFPQPYLCSPQGMAPNYQPEKIKWVHCNTLFQDGVYCQSEGCDTEGLYGEIRPERCILIGPYSTRKLQICMERSVLPITAFWSGLSPENIYEAPSFSGSRDTIIEGHNNCYTWMISLSWPVPRVNWWKIWLQLPGSWRSWGSHSIRKKCIWSLT